MSVAPVRARDLRANIKEHGFENGVVFTLERLLEEFSSHRVHQRELVELVQRAIDEIEKMVAVGSKMRDSIEDVQRIMKDDGYGEQG